MELRDFELNQLRALLPVLERATDNLRNALGEAGDTVNGDDVYDRTRDLQRLANAASAWAEGS